MNALPCRRSRIANSQSLTRDLTIQANLTYYPFIRKETLTMACTRATSTAARTLLSGGAAVSKHGAVAAMVGAGRAAVMQRQRDLSTTARRSIGE